MPCSGYFYSFIIIIINTKYDARPLEAHQVLFLLLELFFSSVNASLSQVHLSMMCAAMCVAPRQNVVPPQFRHFKDRDVAC